MKTPNTSVESELELKLMELFSRSERFGEVFMTNATKEEFADAIKDGALDHQEAAYEAVKLVNAHTAAAVKEADDKAHMIGFKNGKWAMQKRMNDLWVQLMIDEVGSEKAFAYRDAIDAVLTKDKGEE